MVFTSRDKMLNCGEKWVFVLRVSLICDAVGFCEQKVFFFSFFDTVCMPANIVSVFPNVFPEPASPKI